MNTTISYYDNNAKEYCASTVDADMTEAYKRFLKYVTDGGTVIDMGCGSGRDILAFKNMGYQVIGLDASLELSKSAEEYTGASVITADMSNWKAESLFDGVWCCASLLHLDEDGVSKFFDNIRYNLKTGGAIYISVKSGIETGLDNDGRYMKNFTEEEIKKLFEKYKIEIKEYWTNDDSIGRSGFKWINVIGVLN